PQSHRATREELQFCFCAFLALLEIFIRQNPAGRELRGTANMNRSTDVDTSRGNALQLALATGAFAVCFAVFGSVSAMMPILRKMLALDPLQVSLALAVP